MNTTYLMKYISKKLHTVVRRYNSTGQLIESVCERISFQDNCFPAFESLLLQQLDTHLPVLFSSEESVAYASVSSKDFFFLIGPVLLQYASDALHTLPEYSFDQNWLSQLYHCSSDLFLEQILLLNNLFSETELTMEEIIYFNYLKNCVEQDIQTAFNDILFHNHETEKKHNPYDQEMREQNSIRNGDIDQLKRSWAEDYIGEIGTLAKTPLRHYKNLGIVLVTLASRTAINAGVLPEIAFSLSDTYIQKIEDATNPEAAYHLGKQAEYQYTLLVNDLKKQHPVSESLKDLRISRCKDYIFTHLHGKISISDIADELFINKNYLCELFKKEEGITIGDYILQQKIRLVQNMLIYSHYSYSEIAAYFGFSSQSHLGQQFKKITGMTLGQYRETYSRY